jgi:signal transduction histidine kinase
MYLRSDSFKNCKEKMFKATNIIRQNCYRFTKLINNIVDLSKVDAGFFKLNMKNENIVDIIENIVQSVADYIKEKELTIVFDTDIEEIIIACDAEKIERLVLNLISNAIKFTNPGGSVFVKVFSKEDFIEVTVRDTGIGIDEQQLELIFRRFHQVDKSLSRNAEGSGIGLSLAKYIAEAHGGHISVESKINEGSVFSIKIPNRIIEEPYETVRIQKTLNRVEMIDIEFSDIYN